MERFNSIDFTNRAQFLNRIRETYSEQELQNIAQDGKIVVAIPDVETGAHHGQTQLAFYSQVPEQYRDAIVAKYLPAYPRGQSFLQQAYDTIQESRSDPNIDDIDMISVSLGNLAGESPISGLQGYVNRQINAQNESEGTNTPLVEINASNIDQFVPEAEEYYADREPEYAAQTKPFETDFAENGVPTFWSAGNQSRGIVRNHGQNCINLMSTHEGNVPGSQIFSVTGNTSDHHHNNNSLVDFHTEAESLDYTIRLNENNEMVAYFEEGHPVNLSLIPEMQEVVPQNFLGKPLQDVLSENSFAEDYDQMSKDAFNKLYKVDDLPRPLRQHLENLETKGQYIDGQSLHIIDRDQDGNVDMYFVGSPNPVFTYNVDDNGIVHEMDAQSMVGTSFASPQAAAIAAVEILENYSPSNVPAIEESHSVNPSARPLDIEI